MNSKVYNLIKGTVKIFVKKPTIYCDEKLDDIHSSIFVSNHVGFFAPLIINLYSKKVFTPWVIHDITDSKLCKNYLNNYFVEPQLKLKPPLSHILSSAISPICVSIMDYLNAIPVYRESQKVIETIETTLNDLEKGENILIFPENGNKKYNSVIDEFNIGFINTAKIFYKRYGKRISFYPICVNKQKNKISVGRKIEYDPNISFKIERMYIARYLMSSITSMYYDNDEGYRNKDQNQMD